MPKLTPYRQLRMDGGIRAGILADGRPLSSAFEPGDDDEDPRLRWFVDLRCEGPRLPQSPLGARKWLLKHRVPISAGFRRCADDIRAGIDLNPNPIVWENFPETPKEVRLKIVFSALSRDDAIGMADVLREIGDHWEEIVRGLVPLETLHR